MMLWFINEISMKKITLYINIKKKDIIKYF